MEQPQIETQIKSNNKNKLKHQNTKLHQELKRLQLEIEILEAQQAERGHQQTNQNQQLTALKAEIELQQRQIKRLKELIDAGRQTNIKQNVIYIRKEEDELLCLKKQLQNLVQEKEIVTSAHLDKIRKLQQNQPLQRHKDEMQTMWADTKKQNRQLSLKMVELERQIRKYHSIKERAKSKVEATNNEEQQLAHIELEIQRMNQQSESKHVKWKPNIDFLDHQFFSLKAQLNALQKQAEEVEKDENIWKMRAAALRNQSDLQSDRQRLSKIISIVHPQEPAKPIQPKQRYQPTNALPSETRNSVIDNIKRYHLSLPRAESTPNAPSISKKLNNPRQAHDDMSAIKPKQSKLNQSQRNQLNSSRQEIVLALQKSKLRNNKIGNSQVPIVRQPQVLNKSSNKVAKDRENQKNEPNYMGLRDKHRIKSSIATNLAQEIKKKTNQVKSINQSMLGESKSREQSPKSMMAPKNQRVKKSYDNSQHSKNKALQGSKSPLKSNKNSSLTKINSLLPPNQNQITSMNKVINKYKETDKGVDNKSGQQQSKGKKQRQLVEKINIHKVEKIKRNSSSKNNQGQPIRQTPTATHLNRALHANPSIEKGKMVEQLAHAPKASPKAQKHKKEIEASLKKEEKVLEKHLNIAIQLIDETDGVPKIVRRKKLAQGTLVNAGTST